MSDTVADVQADLELSPEVLAQLHDVSEDKPVIGTYAELKEIRRRGGRLARFSILMHAPSYDKTGALLGCLDVPMPAEKAMKWVQLRGMHFVDGPPHVEPPAGEEAATPETTMATAVGRAVAEVIGPRADSGGESLKVFYCEAEGCNRFFDSPDGKRAHERSHK